MYGQSPYKNDGTLNGVLSFRTVRQYSSDCILTVKMLTLSCEDDASLILTNFFFRCVVQNDIGLESYNRKSRMIFSNTLSKRWWPSRISFCCNKLDSNGFIGRRFIQQNDAEKHIICKEVDSIYMIIKGIV